MFTVKYKGQDINIRITNVAVLNAIENFNEKREEFKNIKTFREITDNILASGEDIRVIVEKGGGSFETLFPDPDYAEYVAFIQCVHENMGKQPIKIS